MLRKLPTAVVLTIAPTLTSLLLVSAPASAQELYDGSTPTTGTNSHEVITTTVNGTECRLTTFEGGGNLEAIHPELNNSIAGSGMRFPSVTCPDPPCVSVGWQTLTTGFVSNKPSPPTVAFMTAPSHDIIFDEPVSTVSFFYSSFPAVTLDAFDAADNLVATVTGAANVPIPPFTVWDSIGVDVSANIITRITVIGAAFQTGIDDVSNCRSATTPPERLVSLIQSVISLDLMTGISISFDAKLDRALDALDDLNANNDVAAVNSLNAFINAVNGQSGNAIPVEEADALIEQANAILALL